jgi:putative tryptophan/tyrosine transport system substrate-binding protein
VDGRAFIVGGVVALTGPLGAEAQRPKMVPRVGLLDPGIPHLFLAFREAMHDLGYIEDRNIVYELRTAEAKPEHISRLAAELVKLSPDVIVTAATQPSRAVQEATHTIPIVVAAIGDAVATGLVTNLRQPGGNITGLSFLNTELSAKRLELLKEAFPWIIRVFVLNDMNTAQNIVAETEAAARRLRLQIQRVDVRAPDDFERAFDATTKGRAEALNVLASAYFNAHRGRIVELAARSRLPAMYESRDYVDAGGLMSYGQNLRDLFRRAAMYVDRILKGAKPGDLPMEQPTTFELAVNVGPPRPSASPSRRPCWPGRTR